VIDLLAVSQDRAVIIDYKTTNAGEERLVQLYKPQLDMYAATVGRALCKPVEKYIYSTKHERLVKV
jgi:ATP-dependent exoDNAse (exonuclease V) beta subunit